MTTKEKFIEMAKNITRPGIDEMMAWLETTDFYVAPASTKFHGGAGRRFVRTLCHRCKAVGGGGKPLCARQVQHGCAHDSCAVP